MANVVVEAQGAAINSTTCKWAAAPGTGGSFSTPDSVAASITSIIDIDAEIAPVDWTISESTHIVGKWLGTGDQYSYIFQLQGGGGGKLVFNRSTTGAAGTIVNATSTVEPTVTDGVRLFVRFTFSSLTGDVTFYTSPDGVTWTQLGDVVSTAATGIFDGTAPVYLFENQDLTSQALTGKGYRVRIYNGIRESGGTLAVDFNPNLSTTAQTFTAATGEVWTTNGNARIFGNTNTTYGIPAPWDEDGPLGFLAEGARTNLCLWSEDFTNAAWVNTTVTVAANSVVAPDGTTTADTLTAAGANSTLIQDLGVIGSTAQAFSIYLKRLTGTGNIDITLDGGSTWTTKTITTSWARYEITQTLANPDVGIRIVTSADAIYAWGAQCE